MSVSWQGNAAVFRAYIKGDPSGDGKGTKKRTGDPKSWLSFENAAEYECFGAILNEGFVDISFDSDDLSQKFWDMTDRNKWECLILKNPENGHIHSYWKKPSDWNSKDGENKLLAVGLKADIHSGNTYIPLRVKGTDRFPPLYETEGEPQEVPEELFPVDTKINLLDLKEGEGRNNALFGYINVLQQAFSGDSEITKRILRNTNTYIFNEPLPERELETILRDEAFQQPLFYANRTFQHDVFSQFLINKEHIVKIEGKLHIYREGMYSSDDEFISGAMRELLPKIKKNQKSEVMDYLQDKAPKKDYSDIRFIAFRNCILNIETMERLQFSPEYVIPNKIPWDYNPEAFDGEADRFLKSISCNDENIRDLLGECIGYCFYRKNIYKKIILLKGDKNNGKSTFLDVLTAVPGVENTSSVSLVNFAEKFNLVTIFHKLANISADISSESIGDFAIMKNISSGDRIQVQQKNKPVFEFNPYAKMIFGANRIPKIKDETGAAADRFLIIPFNAEFDENNREWDPKIRDKLIIQPAMEYFIRLGVEGLRRLLSQRGFTRSSRVQKEIEDYNLQNHPEQLFLDELELCDILNHEPRSIYLQFDAFCRENGFEMTMQQPDLTKYICKKLGLKSDSRRNKNKSSRDPRNKVRVFVKN